MLNLNTRVGSTVFGRAKRAELEDQIWAIGFWRSKHVVLDKQVRAIGFGRVKRVELENIFWPTVFWRAIGSQTC